MLSVLEKDELTKCADPISGLQHFLSNYIYIWHPTQQRQKLNPHNYQIALVNEYCKNKNTIVNIARLMGASTISSAYLLWNALFVTDSYILVKSHSRVSSVELIERIRFIFDQLPEFLKISTITNKKDEISFSNGSVIRTGNIWYQTCDILYIENCAYLNHSDIDDLKRLMKQSFDSIGKLILLSTPRENSTFVDIWNKSVTEYVTDTIKADSLIPIDMPWYIHPDRNESWANWQQMQLGNDIFLREYECKVTGQLTMDTLQGQYYVD